MVHGAMPVSTLVRTYGPPLLQLVKLPAFNRVDVGTGLTVITFVPMIELTEQTLEMLAMKKTLLLDAFCEVAGIQQGGCWHRIDGDNIRPDDRAYRADVGDAGDEEDVVARCILRSGR